MGFHMWWLAISQTDISSSACEDLRTLTYMVFAPTCLILAPLHAVIAADIPAESTFCDLDQFWGTARLKLRFTREQGKSKAYRECTTTASRQAFKRQWAESLWTTLMETRTREEREQRIRTMGEKGKFLTREAIVAKLGNGPRAEAGADSYIAHCRGDPETFVKLNTWTGIEEFLFVVGVQDALQSRAQTMTNTQACPLVLLGATVSADTTNRYKFEGCHV